MPYPGEVLPITFGANMHLFVGEPLAQSEPYPYP